MVISSPCLTDIRTANPISKRPVVRHDAKREKGEFIRYTMTGFVWAFMVIPAAHRHARKQPTKKIPRALAWESTLPFSWSRCCTLFVGDKLAPPLETLIPTKVESETDWWKASLEYFEGKHVQSDLVSEQVEIEKDSISEKKRKRESRLLALEGTIDTLESQLLALEVCYLYMILIIEFERLAFKFGGKDIVKKGNKRDFGVVSNGDIPAYMSPGPSYTSHGPLRTSPALTAHKSLLLANRRKLRVIRTPLKLKSPMRCYYRKECVKDAAKKETLKDTIHTHLDASDAAQETGHTEEDLQFIRMEKSDKPNFDLPDLRKIKRNKYPIYSTFEKKKTECYLDCLRKGIRRETSFWDILYPCGEKADYLEQEKLDGNRPRNAQWTLGLSELVAFHIDSGKMMSMVCVVDALRATIDGTNPRYPSGTKSHKCPLQEHRAVMNMCPSQVSPPRTSGSNEYVPLAGVPSKNIGQ
ncbi:hypothetical protein Tco_1164116 [Tanacetum coccineum]